MWSNLPLPVEMIEENRDNLDEIIDCLPGMTETVNSQLQKNPHTKEHLLVKNRSVKSRDYWRESWETVFLSPCDRGYSMSLRILH
jgi:hypothetical protein